VTDDFDLIEFGSRRTPRRSAGRAAPTDSPEMRARTSRKPKSKKAGESKKAGRSKKAENSKKSRASKGKKRSSKLAGRRPGADPASGVIVPLDQWTRVLNQLGNLHEAGQQLADARERAAKAETEAAFLKERLRELRAELEAARRQQGDGR
jgi:hypothetical protein